MSKITVTQTVEVPDGPSCVGCRMLRQQTDYISAREAQRDGLGFSGGSITHYTCGLFNVAGLSVQHGVGVVKLDRCVEAQQGGEVSDG